MARWPRKSWLLAAITLYIVGAAFLGMLLPAGRLSSFPTDLGTRLLGWSPDGRIAALEVAGKELQFRDAVSGKQLSAFQLSGRPEDEYRRLWKVHFSDDGRVAALYTHGGDLVAFSHRRHAPLVRTLLLETATGRLLWEDRDSVEETVSAVAFAPDGRTALVQHAPTRGRDELVAWDIAGRREIARWPGTAQAAAFAANGTRIVTCQQDGLKLAVRDWPTGKLVRKLLPIPSPFSWEGAWPQFVDDGRRVRLLASYSRNEMNQCCWAACRVLGCLTLGGPELSTLTPATAACSATLLADRSPFMRGEFDHWVVATFNADDSAPPVLTYLPGRGMLVCPTPSQAVLVEKSECDSGLGLTATTVEVSAVGADGQLGSKRRIEEGMAFVFEEGTLLGAKSSLAINSLRFWWPRYAQWQSWLPQAVYDWLESPPAPNSLVGELELFELESGRRRFKLKDTTLHSFSPDDCSFIALREAVTMNHVEIWRTDGRRDWLAILCWPLLPAVGVGLLGFWRKRRAQLRGKAV